MCATGARETPLLLLETPLSTPQVFDVCATGARNVLDAFLPVCAPGARAVVVSTGLSPLMCGYARADRRRALTAATVTWREIEGMMRECLRVPGGGGEGGVRRQARALRELGFPGGPFEEAAPDFHVYGLAKLFADAHMLSLARGGGGGAGLLPPGVMLNACDPGLVYTGLITRMPRYVGKTREETGAQTAEEGVEAAMRLLFGGAAEGVVEGESGRFYAMSRKQPGVLLNHKGIDRQPE